VNDRRFFLIEEKKVCAKVRLDVVGDGLEIPDGRWNFGHRCGIYMTSRFNSRSIENLKIHMGGLRRRSPSKRRFASLNSSDRVSAFTRRFVGPYDYPRDSHWVLGIERQQIRPTEHNHVSGFPLVRLQFVDYSPLRVLGLFQSYYCPFIKLRKVNQAAVATCFGLS